MNVKTLVNVNFQVWERTQAGKLGEVDEAQDALPRDAAPDRLRQDHRKRDEETGQLRRDGGDGEAGLQHGHDAPRPDVPARGRVPAPLGRGEEGSDSAYLILYIFHA